MGERRDPDRSRERRNGQDKKCGMKSGGISHVVRNASDDICGEILPSRLNSFRGSDDNSHESDFARQTEVVANGYNALEYHVVALAGASENGGSSPGREIAPEERVHTSLGRSVGWSLLWQIAPTRSLSAATASASR